MIMRAVGILVVGWGAKSVMWSSVWGTVSETLAVQQKQNVAHYGELSEAYADRNILLLY